LTDLAVSDVYEPGSTFKLVTYATALDAAGVQPEDIVDCQNGSMMMYGRTLHDDNSEKHFGAVTVQYALEHSSDVGAAKMALKVGPATFYKYIRAFGFGDRTGIELPSETRGLLRAPKQWDATSILSLAIGQEVAVTPIQLVTMVSTIANGGVYMPPHVLLQSTDEMKGDPRLQPAAFRPANQLPEQLPDGAHRVISEMTSAKMRRMMEGIVTEGTGKEAALNGYSAGGKTGTAQKIDVQTHTYSKTMHVASFAGMAPVSNPAITVAVVIDSPSAGGSYYGAEVSAPVFQKVAQEVLEYLGVPHDQPLKTPAQMMAAVPSPEDGASDEVGDLNAMFEQANHLPADDPLRAMNSKPASVADEGASAGANPIQSAAVIPLVRIPPSGLVTVDAGQRVAVPSFAGSALRGAIETAEGLGLRVAPVGSGVAREQMPAAGTMVPVGTEVVVRFER
jgi:cell division protein FtsI (penicillin-binding protein 3)